MLFLAYIQVKVLKKTKNQKPAHSNPSPTYPSLQMHTPLVHVACGLHSSQLIDERPKIKSENNFRYVIKKK